MLKNGPSFCALEVDVDKPPVKGVQSRPSPWLTPGLTDINVFELSIKSQGKGSPISLNGGLPVVITGGLPPRRLLGNQEATSPAGINTDVFSSPGKMLKPRKPAS